MGDAAAREAERVAAWHQKQAADKVAAEERARAEAAAAEEEDQIMGFSSQEYKRLRGLFIELDTSGEGSLDAEELRLGLEKHVNVIISEKEADEMIATADTDKNGTVEWDEFLEMMIKSRDLARAGTGNLDLEHWLESWLPKLARMRLVARQEKAESGRSRAPSFADGDSDANSEVMSAVAPEATAERLAEPRVLTAGEIRELRAAFALIDDDGSGRLDGGEILDALAAEKVACNEDAVVQMCVEAGSEDGEISLEQFLWYVAMRAPPNSRNKRKARGSNRVITRDWWWRWLFPVPEDAERANRREGDDGDDEVARRRREGLAKIERPPRRVPARDLRRDWSTKARRVLDGFFDALYAFETGAKPDGESRLGASALGRALAALGRKDADDDAASRAIRVGDWRSGTADRGVSRSDFYECVGSRDDEKLAKTVWAGAFWAWFPRLETRADVKARLELDDPSKRLTREQRKHYGSCFDELDVNGDGSISATELVSTLTSLGVKMTEEESFGMVTMADDDGNGGIERDEFMALMARFNGGSDGAGAVGKWQLYWIKWLKATRVMLAVRARRDSNANGGRAPRPSFKQDGAGAGSFGRAARLSFDSRAMTEEVSGASPAGADRKSVV